MGKKTDLLGTYERIKRESRETMVRATIRAVSEAWEDYLTVAENKMKDMFHKSIEEFYNDYNPLEDGGYRRNKSLFDILELEEGDVVSNEFDGETAIAGGLNYGFDAGKVTAYRNGYRSSDSGEDGLYNLVFIRGYHGGARFGPGHPSPGRAFWRFPAPVYSRWFGREAERSTPPYDAFMSKFKEYWCGPELQKDFSKVWDAHKGDIARYMREG